MKKQKHYFLIIPSSDIYTKIKGDSVKIIDGSKAKKIFDDYQIPTDYQKIVVKVPIKTNVARELLTHSTYYLKESLTKIILNNKKEIYLESTDNIIDTKLSLYNIDKVKEFYQGIIDNKITSKYEQAIKEIYKYHYLNKERIKKK